MTKEDYIRFAREHTEEMAKKYPKDIQHAIDSTIIYDEKFQWDEQREQTTKIELLSTDMVTALRSRKPEECGKMAVLNFASYKNPGGKFLEGSTAQEENLCHESFLYNVLKEFDSTYYAYNRKHLNNAMYTNRALYTPNIPFIRNGKPRGCDVITCAAPNWRAASHYGRVRYEANLNALSSRIYFVLDIAEAQNVDTLILGAWGCGVFGQDPKKVADLFVTAIISCYGFKNVVFAIPSKFSDNYIAFANRIREAVGKEGVR